MSAPSLHSGAVFDAIADGVLVFDSRGLLVGANAEAVRLLALPTDNPVPSLGIDAPWEVVDAAGEPLPLDKWPVVRTLRRGEPQQAVILGVRRPGGVLAWVELSTRPLGPRARDGAVVTLRDAASRVAARDRQRATDQRFADLVESLDAIVWEVEFATKQLLYVSPQAERILGYTAAQWITEPDFWREHLHPDDREATVQYFAEQSALGRNCALEYRMIAADGREVWFRDTVTVTTQPDGRVLQRGVLLDITDERRTRQRLATEQARLGSIVSATRMGTWEWNVQTGEVVLNARWAEIIGYTLDELAPLSIQTWVDVCHPDDLAHSNEIFRRHFAGELPFYDCEVRLRHRDGHWVWVHDTGQLVERSPDGEPLLVVGTHHDVTERRLAAAERHRLALVAEQTTNGVVITDLAGRVQWVNPAFEAMTGYALDELMGRKPGSLLQGPQSDPASVQRIREAIAARRPFSEQLINYRQDGAPYWIHIVCNPMRDESGRESGFLAIETDVTAQRRAQEALYATESLLSRAGHVARVGGWEMDVQQGTLRWTAETKRIHEVPPDYEPTLEAALQFYGPEARETLRVLIDRAIHEDQPFDVELPLETATGRRIWIRSAGDVERVDGHAVRLFGALQDVTSRKLAEAEMLASREQFMLAVRGSQDGIWDWDVRSGRVFFSERYAEQLGYRIDELPGTVDTFMALLHPDDQGRVSDMIQAYLAGELEVYAVEFRARRKDGSYAWVLARGAALRDENGVAYRMAGSHTDITERKTAEEERLRLEARVQQADKMESVGRLAGGIAHDFNNMLSVILGHANLLLEEAAVDQEMQAALTEIRLAAERSAELTRQLLGFSRQQPVLPRTLDLDDTIAGLLTMLRRLIGEDIDLAWHPSMLRQYVRIDPGQVTQVLTNLCLNARDAIRGGGRIDVATARVVLDAAACRGRAGLVPGAFVALTVRDTGLGIPPHVLSHIFEPFFTTKALGQGTGLGLATVYGIARQNGGWVDVESEVGSGTLFRVLLPALPDDPAADVELVEGEPVPLGQGETILLVEDETALLAVAERLLRGLGYRVLATDRPELALDLAAQHAGAIDLLVTDVVMAGLSGRELMERLRSGQPHLPCLYVSGYTADIISAHGVLHDGAHFLAKPYSRADLARKVREVLDAPRAPVGDSLS